MKHEVQLESVFGFVQSTYLAKPTPNPKLLPLTYIPFFSIAFHLLFPYALYDPNILREEGPDDEWLVRHQRVPWHCALGFRVEGLGFRF